MRLPISQIQSAVNLPRLTGFFWLVTKLLSYKVWLTDRFFPVVPVFDVTGSIPAYIHTSLFVLSLMALGLLIWQPQRKGIMIFLLSMETAATMLDYARWQPWEYQYISMFVVFIACAKDRQRVATLLLLCSALYVYSGIQKFNAGFLTQVWQHMILMPFLKLPHALRMNPLIHYAGYLIPAAEVLFGISLLLGKTRKLAAYALIAIHLFNLLWLGPLGANYNVIVWPWNLFMISLLLALLCYDGNIFSPHIFSLRIAPLLLLWLIMPLFNLIDRWDHYLSWSLYSGKLPLMVMCSDTLRYGELKPYAAMRDPNVFCEDKSLIKIQSWAMKEMRVPPYPELRYYKKLAKILQHKYPGSTSALYYYISPQNRMPLP